MKVGILGGGQLGAMMAQAAENLDVEVAVFDPSEDCYAGKLTTHFCHDYDDFENLKAFADWSEMITYEWENVPLPTVRYLAESKKVRPTIEALALTQDRLSEKEFLNGIGIETAAFLKIETADDLVRAGEQLGFPYFLKTRHGGYDGKGQWKITEADLETGNVPDVTNRKLIAEKAISFDRELSMVAVRNRKGEFRFYDVCENHHKDGILHHTINLLNDSFQAEAEDKAAKLMDKLEYCGVLALEYFQADGKLLANEYAPRVHNSGHWTIEGAETSQFESHLRAICDLPLTSVKSKGHFMMYNLIGGVPESYKQAPPENATLHDYLKEPRPGRKAGHLTLQLDAAEDYQDKLDLLNKIEAAAS